MKYINLNDSKKEFEYVTAYLVVKYSQPDMKAEDVYHRNNGVLKTIIRKMIQARNDYFTDKAFDLL